MSAETFMQSREATAVERYRGPASTSDVIRQAMVVVALAVTIFINYLSNALPLNGRTAGEISDSFPVRFTPAGYVFSIWGLIYLGLIAYAIYQALPAQRANPRLRAILWPFILSCMANSTWIFAWHFGYFIFALVLIIILLCSLIVLYQRLYLSFPAVSTAERWSTHIPFRIYTGWATVATIANTTITLYDLGWQGAPLRAELWAAILVVVATGIGLFFAFRLRDAAYTFVLVWAFVGIYVKQGDAPITAYTALIAAGVLAIAAIFALLNPQKISRALVGAPDDRYELVA
ncbi:MAG: tryptophan-rich sensory protein [Caldilineaceae bacterium]